MLSSVFTVDTIVCWGYEASHLSTIAGSPLTVDVVDLRDVKASGEGLRKGVIGKESRFSVEGTDDIEAVIAMVTEQGKMNVNTLFTLTKSWPLPVVSASAFW